MTRLYSLGFYSLREQKKNKQWQVKKWINRLMCTMSKSGGNQSVSFFDHFVRTFNTASMMSQFEGTVHYTPEHRFGVCNSSKPELKRYLNVKHYVSISRLHNDCNFQWFKWVLSSRKKSADVDFPHKT